MARKDDPIRQMVIEARRNQILDAAERVFAQNGFHPAKTRAIAREAGVSEGTIYNYFDSKADLLIGLMGRMARLDVLKQALTADQIDLAAFSDPEVFVRTVLRERFEIARQNQQAVQAVMPEMLVNPELGQEFNQRFVADTVAVLEQHLQTRIDLGQMRPMDVALVGRALQAMFLGSLVLRLLGDDVTMDRWDDLPDAMADLLLHGLLVAESVEK